MILINDRQCIIFDFMRNLLFLIASLFAFQEFNAQFFSKADDFFSKYVVNDGVNYQGLKLNNGELNQLITEIEQANLDGFSEDERKAFYINAYNLLVINQVIENYPVQSVMNVPGFFDKQKFVVAGEKLTLNQLEKDKLLKPYKDPRLHFVLVCGAKGCPPITNFAYRTKQLENQLNNQTRRALNNPLFIRETTNGTQVSQLFEWYINDFGESKTTTVEFINTYRNSKINPNITYYAYDWSLNDASTQISNSESSDVGTNANRYVVSAAIPKGSSELKVFNNLYTQSTGTPETFGSRSNFFTATLSYLYGLNNRFNLGFETRYRKVSNVSLPSSPFAVFTANKDNTFSVRQGITGIGPKIRWAPVKKWSHFSLQSTLLVPFVKDQEGSSTKPYIDWNGPVWYTQFFYDRDLGSSFSIFTEIDFWAEDIGFDKNENFNRFSTPVTLILSYFPVKNLTIYGLSSYSPYFLDPYDYFYQYGLGAKYQFTQAFELEFLYTNFNNKFLNEAPNGNASTINLGVRSSF